MRSYAKVVVCVFAKPPVAGQVKTRLAAELGEAVAAELARAFLSDTWSQVQGLPWAKPVLATTVIPSNDLTASLGISEDQIWLQGDGDLGARVERVMRRAVAEADFAIALGADAPGLPTSRLEAACIALGRAGHKGVIGPADDGGFYLLGLASCPEGLLLGLPWSRSDTYGATLSRLQQSALSPAVLEPWFDVDRVADLWRLEQLLDREEIVAPETHRALSRLRLRLRD